VASPVKSGRAMFCISSLRLTIVSVLISSSFTLAASSVQAGQDPVCVLIGASTSSSSDVYYPGTKPFILQHHAMTFIIVLIGDQLYTKGVSHWANYTSQAAKCVVEPGTAADVGIIVRNSFLMSSHNRLIPLKLGIVGKTRTPFAVSHIAFLFHAYLKW